jgi:hypothetical protein
MMMQTCCACAVGLHCVLHVPFCLLACMHTFDIISGPFTILGSLAPKAEVISLANRVLPQPGGPYRSMPRTGEMPSSFVMAGG